MRKAQREACLEVADAIVEGRNDWGFNMNFWISNPNASDYEKDYNAGNSPNETGQIDFNDFYHGEAPVHNCGTSFCIAGWAVALFPRRAKGKKFLDCIGDEYDTVKRGAEILGLKFHDANILFHSMDEVKSKLHAARILRLFAHGDKGAEKVIKHASTKRRYEKRLAELQAV